KYLEVSTPGRVEATPRRHPVLDAVSPRIDTLVAEWHSRTTAKQRLTAAGIHRQLLSEGYAISDRSVRLYLHQKRLQSAEVFIPLSYLPVALLTSPSALLSSELWRPRTTSLPHSPITSPPGSLPGGRWCSCCGCI